jgi:hypothetical protein
MSNRKINTQNRNQQLNKIWSYMSAVNEASKLVYKSDYAKLQQYILYKATVIDNKSNIASEDEIAN